MITTRFDLVGQGHTRENYFVVNIQPATCLIQDFELIQIIADIFISTNWSE